MSGAANDASNDHGVVPLGELGGGPPAAFRHTTARGSVNYMLRNTQQQLVQLSGQADLKASILITASSVVLTVGLTRATDSRFEVAFGVLAGFLIVALLASILCVLPSFAPWNRGKPLRGAESEPNLLFFGDFTKMPEREFVERLGDLSKDDGAVYAMQARDLYRQGAFLLTHKYRYLRISYSMFLLGFIVSSVIVIVTIA
jgi:Family of unknown function (DUF5706)